MRAKWFVVNEQISGPAMDDVPAPVMTLAQALAGCLGVVGVVLGGSRARGRNAADADFNLGLYYGKDRFDWAAVTAVLKPHDDSGEPRGLAPPGAWGPWMNGGAWNRVGGLAVDVLLREMEFVEGVARDAHSGSFSSNYLPGHPHGWHSFMLLGEVYHNIVLSGDFARLGALRESVDPYPEALRAAVVDRFLYEARFSAVLLRKIVDREEIAQSAGLAYRCAMCMVQVLFALHYTYLVNEKGAVAVAAGFEHVPRAFSTRIDQALGTSEFTRAERSELLSGLVDEVEDLVRSRHLVTSWSGSSFPLV